MNPKFGGRSWVKLWVNEWLDGTTRFEMSSAQRAFWIDLLALAGRSRFPGRICAGQVEGHFVGYPLGKFEGLMTEPIDVEKTLKLFESTGKVKITETSQNPIKLLMIELINWDRYQSEYQRQRPYREAKRKRLQQSDSQSYKQSNKTEGEVEGEVEEKHKRKSIAPSAPKRSKSWPESFELSPDLRTFGIDHGMENPNAEFAAFKDYHQARGSTFKDWPAAWRTWARNYSKFRRTTNEQNPRKSFDAIREENNKASLRTVLEHHRNSTSQAGRSTTEGAKSSGIIDLSGKPK